MSYLLDEGPGVLTVDAEKPRTLVVPPVTLQREVARSLHGKGDVDGA